MTRRINCPSCPARFEAVVPSRDRHMQSLFGTPMLWAATGEKYAWLACPECGSRFVAVTDRPFKPGPDGNAEVLAVARAYVEAAGLPPLTEADRQKLTTDVGREIATFYEKAKSDPDDPDVQSSYFAFRAEVKAQHEALRKAGFELLPWDGLGQPYSNSDEMRRDVMKNKRLFFFKTIEGMAPHALLPPEDNDRFRAVHDVFGHAMGGHGFGPQGETNAFRDHYQMFSPTARKAMATESLGQNAWFNYSKHNEGRPSAQRDYPEQHALLLKPELYEDLVQSVFEAL